MAHDVPPELAALLDVPEGPSRDEAWGAFVLRHSRLLLHVARSFGGDHDAVMDRYTFFLQRLQSEDCRRLRTWARDRRSKLTTWLVIVTQRLSLDEHRRRYGRPRGESSEAAVARTSRRRLADLLAEEVDQDRQYPQAGDPNDDPETALRRAELVEALNRSVGELATSD